MRIGIVDSTSSLKDYTQCLCNAFDADDDLYLFNSGSYYAQRGRHVPVFNRRGKGIVALYYMISGWLRFFIFLKKEVVDVLHIQWVEQPFLFCLLCKATNPRMKLIFTAHNSDFSHGRKDIVSLLQGLGYSKALLMCNKVIVHTHYSASVLTKKIGIAQSAIKIIRHGLLGVGSHAPANSRRRCGKFTLLLFGIITDYKGYEEALNALQILHENKVTDFRVVIAGRFGKNSQQLRTLLETEEIRRFVELYEGFVPEKEVSSYFNQADAVMLPYKHIDASGVLMLSVQYGRPIMATSLPGFVEQLGKAGVYFYCDNKDSILDAFLDISNPETNKYYEQEIKKLRDNWPTWEEIVSETKRAYE